MLHFWERWFDEIKGSSMLQITCDSGEEVQLGQLIRWDLSLLSCLSPQALGCAIQLERH